MVGIRGQVVASHIRGDTFVPLDSTRYESKPPTDGHPKTAGNPLKHIEHNTSGRATTQPHFGPTPLPGYAPPPTPLYSWYQNNNTKYPVHKLQKTLLSSSLIRRVIRPYRHPPSMEISLNIKKLFLKKINAIFSGKRNWRLDY